MKPEKAKPVKYFVGALFTDIHLLNKSINDMEGSFSHVDLQSDDFPFDITDYYNKEMGEPIFRRFLSFAELRSPGEIGEAKLTSNATENKYKVNGKRKVNLDVGYIDYDKVVLASTKYGIHKIYIGKGIYADMTLHYEKGKFIPYPWAFIDFKIDRYYKFFLELRELYKNQLKRN
jgi:hypothetical protein